MKVLFIHGLASSGAYKMSSSLRILLRPCEVVAPDVPIDPDAALSMLLALRDETRPDLVVGLSLGGFLTVTPGVRFADSAADDQSRITTPARAREIGSDYIVVGRPVTAAADPVAAYRRCVKEFLNK